MFRTSKVRFATIGLQPKGSFNRSFGLRQPRRGVIKAEEVEVVQSVGQPTLGKKKGRVALQSLVEEINSFFQVLCTGCTEIRRQNKIVSAGVEIEGDQVGRRPLRDRVLLSRRKFRL